MNRRGKTTRADKTLLLKKAATSLLLFSFVITPFAQIHAQVAGESSNLTSESSNPSTDLLAIDPVLNLGQEIFAGNYEPQMTRSVESTNSEATPRQSLEFESGEQTEGFGDGEMMSLMSGTEPLTDYLYTVANDIGNSTVLSTQGGFAHSVPIVIPPGRNGMEPSLSLQYSSSASEETNIVGYGWDIPIPYIERRNIDGIEDLFTESDFSSSMSGELSTTTSPGVFVARTDDGSFLSYEFASSTSQWTVKSKDGNVFKFGHASSTRMDNPADSSKVFKWMLEEVRDTNGNYVKYEYFKDSGYIYPDRVTYTGNGSTDGIFTVDFNLEVRTDVATSTAPGFAVKSNYLVNEITASIDGEWVRKYELAYITGDNDYRSLLDTVTESGRTEGGSPTTITLPAIDFTYQSATSSWATTTDFALPEKLVTGSPATDTGTRIADINGDALPDIVKAQQGTTTKIYINNGTGWSLNGGWTFPTHFADSTGKDLGTRFVDLNADGLNDVVQFNSSQATSTAYLNTGSGWTQTSEFQLPVRMSYSNNGYTLDSGARFGDINGDGLIDLVEGIYFPEGPFGTTVAYFNTGSGFVNSGWTVPIAHIVFWNNTNPHTYTLGTAVEDVNGDGLADLITSDNDSMGAHDYAVYINNGAGWTHSNTWSLPSPIAINGTDVGQRLVDVNGDNLPDWIDSANVLINNGKNWVDDNSWSVPVGFQGAVAFHIVDLNGDGMPDFVQRNDSSHVRYMSNSKHADKLSRVQESTGSKIGVTYKSSATYTDGSGNELNPSLPFPIQTVQAVSYDDGLGNIGTTTYAYTGGDFYYNNPFDRTFAGFGMVQKTDEVGNVSKSYYHQGNVSATTTGEFSDDRSKIGRTYRTESYDSASNLYDAQVMKWESTNRTGNAKFVYSTRQTSLNYDGDGDHRDTASTNSYSTTTGNLSEKIIWGEVNGSNDGSFTDTGTDKRTSAYAYAASSTAYLILPWQETISDQGSVKISESKYYYDTLSLGSIGNGNLTKQEQWKSGSDYIDTEKTYNSYGLVTQEKDPRDKITTYTYDTPNLYVATSTNPLSQTIARTYDYSSGKVVQITDSNDRVFQTTYDALDRVKEEKQPDLSSPSTLVTRSAYEYTDTAAPRRIKRTDYLDSGTNVDTYTYVNGSGKKVQERTEAEGSNVFVARDYAYDGRGLLKTESLPYFSTGTSHTATTSPASADLSIEYTYDPLQRVKSITNNIGSSTNAYDQWTVISTDPEGNTKRATKDAYGNLASIVEVNGVSEYTTVYEYNGLNKLTKITDAEGNLRNFVYDGLGRRLTAQDLHDAADGTFGTWSFAYDDAGNIASTTDPKSQNVVFTYDDLNRLLTEDFTGQGGTEVQYAYDTCANGVTRLCTATSTGAVTSFIYNPVGLVTDETKVIGGSSFTTSYEYDRLGNSTNIKYPDDSEVAYSYNNAGHVESIEQKEGGGSFADIVSNFDYAPIGKISFKELANRVVTEYTYDPTQIYRLTRILTTKPTMEELMSMGMEGGPGSEFMNMFYLDTVTAESESKTLNSSENIPSSKVEEDNAFPTSFIEAPTEAVPLDYVPDSSTGTSPMAFLPGILELPLGYATTSEPETSIEDIEITSENESLTVDESGQLASPEPIESASPTLDIATSSIPLEIKEDIQTDVATSTDQLAKGATDYAAYLKSLPIDSTVLKLAVPESDLLGHEEFSDGIVKYAYKTDVSVDALPADQETVLQASKSGLALGSEVVEQRTNYARTFTTDQENVFVAEIGSGDPQYYEDEKGEWWLADYGVTTKAAYDLQVGIEVPVLEELVPAREPIIEEPVIEEPPQIEAPIIDPPIEITPVIEVPVIEIETSASTVPIQEETIIQGIVRHIKSAFAYVGRALGIIPERAYASTGTFYPDPNTEVTSVDGEMYKDNSTSWSTVRNASASNWGSDANAGGNILDQLGNGNGSTRYGIRRAFLLFDTSSIPDNSSVGSTSVNVYITDVTAAGSEKRFYVVSSNPASNTSLSTNDYDQLGGTSYGISDGTYTVNTYETVPLNSTGIAAVNKTGVSKFGLRTYNDFNNVTATNSNELSIGFYFSEQTGLTNDPKLIVVYSLPPTAPTSLQTDGQTNPSTLTDPIPQFSAIFNDGDSADVATHFRIQLSTVEDFSTTTWDTAKTALSSTTPVGTRSPNIMYAGSSLASSTPYYWRVKFWDDGGVEGDWNSSPAAFSLSPLQPTSLLTEGSVNPVGIEDATPEFSAIYEDTGIGSIATKYRIQVATSSTFASLHWDSGTTTLASSTPRSSRIADVSYAGSTLASSTPYYWRIKFENSTGAATAWSANSSFVLAGPGIPLYKSVVSSGWGGGSGGVTVSPPPGLQLGDLMVAVVAVDTSAGNTPTGWTFIVGEGRNNDRTGLAAFAKIAETSDLATSTTYSFNGSAEGINAAIIRVANGDLASIQHSLVFRNSWPSGQVPFGPTTNPLEENSLLIIAGHAAEEGHSVSDFGIANDNPTWTEIVDEPHSNNERLWGVGVANRQSATTTGAEFYITPAGYNPGRVGYGLMLAVAGNALPEATTLKTNGEVNPLYVNDSTPDFTAIYQDEDTGDVSTHYRIQVSATSTFASTVWDTSKTAFTSSTTIGSTTTRTYGGSALTYETPYYWRIKLWDKNKAEGEWSSTAGFYYTLTSDSNEIQDLNYTYDAAGNITQIKDHSGTDLANDTIFTYDDLNRLTSASTTAATSTPYSHSYNYSSIGNITSKTGQGSYSYGETGYTNPHAATSIGSTTLTYDANGNLLSEGTNTYSWDYLNRMIGTNIGSGTSTYAYDHTVQRISKTAGTTTTHYPNRLYNTDGNTTTKYVYAGDEVIAAIETVGETSEIQYMHADHLGSTNVVTDSTASVSELTDYYPFGGERTSLGSYESQRTYIGQYKDTENGNLSYLNARYMDSEQGQFLSQDPVFWEVGMSEEGRLALINPQTQNSYNYAGNNPINFKDPTGRYFELSFSGSALGRSFSTGIRVDIGGGLETFGSLGIGIGYHSGAEAMWNPGLLSNKKNSSVTLNSTAAKGYGVRVSQEIASNNSSWSEGVSSVYPNTGLPSGGVVLGAGSSVTIQQEFSVPILKSNPNSKISKAVSDVQKKLISILQERVSSLREQVKKSR